jgi:hypothetical protein
MVTNEQDKPYNIPWSQNIIWPAVSYDSMMTTEIGGERLWSVETNKKASLQGNKVLSLYVCVILKAKCLRVCKIPCFYLRLLGLTGADAGF